MSAFLSRVHEAKARYCHLTGEWPDQLFLGPKEYMEFKEMCAQYPWSLGTPCNNIADECAGMTIIALMSDGLRTGKTVE